MQYETVKSWLLLYAGSDDIVRYEPLLHVAMAQVEQQLLPMADVGDPRLCQLAAAICFQTMQRIEAAHDRQASTYAGTLAERTDSAAKQAAANRLVQELRAGCRDLLRDEAFQFFSC